MKLLLLGCFPLCSFALFSPKEFVKQDDNGKLKTPFEDMAPQENARIFQGWKVDAEARKTRLSRIRDKAAKKLKESQPIQTESRFSNPAPLGREQPKDNEPTDIFELNTRVGIAPYLFEGDMDLSEQQLALLERMYGETRAKRQLPKFAVKWPENTVNFYFDPILPISDRKKSLVRAAHEYIQSRTCINFVEDTTAALNTEGRAALNVIRVYNGTGCFSEIGMKGGIQGLSFGNGCEQMGAIAHEFTHALGVVHTQSRSDRDNYVTVNTSAIQNGHNGDFYKLPVGSEYTYTPYDYGSFMHYPADAFLKDNDSLPIIPKDNRYLYTLGNRRISFYDIQMINALYGCDAVCTESNSAKCKNGGVPNPRNCGECNCPRGYGGSLCDEKPSGCGRSLEATSNWKMERFFNSFPEKTNPDLESECTHWITAPAGKQIEVKIRYLKTEVCRCGCLHNGIEIKTEANPRTSNPIICCQKFFNQAFKSSLNPTPVVSYTKEMSNAYVFEYRYVDGPVTPVKEITTVKTTPPTTTTTQAPPPSRNCRDMSPSDLCESAAAWGHCSNVPFRTAKYTCGKTCGFCGKTASPCIDSSKCPDLIANGGCNSVDPMKAELDCAKTCGYCEYPN